MGEGEGKKSNIMVGGYVRFKIRRERYGGFFVSVSSNTGDMIERLDFRHTLQPEHHP